MGKLLLPCVTEGTYMSSPYASLETMAELTVEKSGKIQRIFLLLLAVQLCNVLNSMCGVMKF